RPYMSFAAFKEDPFNKRMAMYRSLPISLHAIVLSRTLLMLTTLFLVSTVFYLVLTLGLVNVTDFFTYISPLEYGYFIVFWGGYALALGGYNTFIEYGTNGKILHLASYSLMI